MNIENKRKQIGLFLIALADSSGNKAHLDRAFLRSISGYLIVYIPKESNYVFLKESSGHKIL